jgi:hypothetical protein
VRLLRGNRASTPPPPPQCLQTAWAGKVRCSIRRSAQHNMHRAGCVGCRVLTTTQHHHTVPAHTAHIWKGNPLEIVESCMSYDAIPGWWCEPSPGTGPGTGPSAHKRPYLQRRAHRLLPRARPVAPASSSSSRRVIVSPACM